jgi:hypothetical protein
LGSPLFGQSNGLATGFGPGGPGGGGGGGGGGAAANRKIDLQVSFNF